MQQRTQGFISIFQGDLRFSRSFGHLLNTLRMKTGWRHKTNLQCAVLVAAGVVIKTGYYRQLLQNAARGVISRDLEWNDKMT